MLHNLYRLCLYMPGDLIIVPVHKIFAYFRYFFALGLSRCFHNGIKNKKLCCGGLYVYLQIFMFYDTLVSLYVFISHAFITLLIYSKASELSVFLSRFLNFIVCNLQNINYTQTLCPTAKRG